MTCKTEKEDDGSRKVLEVTVSQWTEIEGLNSHVRQEPGNLDAYSYGHLLSSSHWAKLYPCPQES